MFKKNNTHEKAELFNFYETILSSTLQQKLDKGWGKRFYTEMFKNIDEAIFTPMYSENFSRPNFPINILVSLLILKMKFNYSDEELFEQYNYNIMFRTALGLRNFDEYPLVSRTYYNFKKRLIEHEENTGKKLMEEFFQWLNSVIQLKYAVSAHEQRIDSTLIWSNIKNMSRLELCIETFKKFYSSVKCDSDIQIEKYVAAEAENYCFKLKKEDVAKELEAIGIVLYRYYLKYIKDDNVNQTEEFKLIERLLHEQFKAADDMKMVMPKENKDLKSSFLQNPHDPEATYRQKGSIKSKGYAVTVSETASDTNLFNIVTDITVSANNESDGKILEQKIPQFKEEGVQTIYADGGYDEKGLAQTAEAHNIGMILTGLKGKEREKGKLKIDDFTIQKDTIQTCPCGYVPSSIEHIAETIRITFAADICDKCAKHDDCLVKRKHKGYQLQIKKQYLKKVYSRKQMTVNEYKKAVGIRAVCESTMKQIKWCCYKDKIRFRRQKNIHIIFIARAIAINFGRINGYCKELLANSAKIINNSDYFLQFFSHLLKNTIFVFFLLKRQQFSIEN